MAIELVRLNLAHPFQLAVVGGPYWPLVDAGADVGSHPNNTEVTRTATEDDRGSAITAREWRVVAGPALVGTVLSTAALLEWTPTVAGAYVLRYTATNAVGFGFDTMTVVVAGATNEIDLFLGAGQSNLLYVQGDGSLAPDPEDGTAYRYNQLGLSSLNTAGGPIPAFAVAYYSATGRIAAYWNKALGGSAQVHAARPLKNWSDTGTLYADSVSAIDAAIADLTALGYTVNFRGVIWDQGGADAIEIDNGTPGVSKAQYKADLLATIARYRTEFGASVPFFMIRLGRESTGDTPGWLDVRTAQDEVVAADPFTHFIHEDAVNFPDEGKMADTVHYNQAGYNEVGSEGGAYVANALAGGGGGTLSFPWTTEALLFSRISVPRTMHVYTLVPGGVISVPRVMHVAWSQRIAAVATMHVFTGSFVDIGPPDPLNLIELTVLLGSLRSAGGVRANVLSSVGDWGTPIMVRALDGEPAGPIDPTIMDAVTATVIRPDRSEEQITLEPSTHPDYPTEVDPSIDYDRRTNPDGYRAAGGWMQYVILAPEEYDLGEDGWLNQKGLWRLRPRYTIDDVGSWQPARPAAFHVLP